MAHQVARMPERELAELVQRDRIDILLELTGRPRVLMSVFHDRFCMSCEPLVQAFILALSSTAPLPVLLLFPAGGVRFMLGYRHITLLAWPSCC